SRRETQSKFPRVPSLIPRSFATWAIGRDVSITIFTASSLNSGEKLFFGRGKFLPFQIVHPNGRTVRKPRGTSVAFIMAWDGAGGGDCGPAVLAGFRRELHGCFGARADALFELCDAGLWAGGRAPDLARVA